MWMEFSPGLTGRFVPRFFEVDISDGRPKLSEGGRKAIQEEVERIKKEKAAAGGGQGSL